MANRYYQPGEQRARGVVALFDTIAPRYDLLNDLQSMGLHRRWKQRLVRRAALTRGSRVLDVCCGTGDLVFAMSRAGARVVGLDFSERMLEVARHRMRRWNGEMPLLVRGDALRMPVDADVFDVVTMGYGLRNLGSFEGGLRECWRVTRPGGCLLILDFGKPSNRLLQVLYSGYLRLVVPLFGAIGCGDADSYAYIAESLRDYPAAGELADLARNCGWEGVRMEHWFGGMMNLTQAFKPRTG